MLLPVETIYYLPFRSTDQPRLCSIFLLCLIAITNKGGQAFIPVSWKDNAPEHIKDAWSKISDAMMSAEITARDQGDPLVFHATDESRVGLILWEGVESDIYMPAEEGPVHRKGMYFGTFTSAAHMAEKSARPVIIAIRTSALERAGLLHPDFNIFRSGPCRGGERIWADKEDPKIYEGDEIVTWEESLNMLGAIGWEGEEIPDGYVVLSPWDPEFKNGLDKVAVMMDADETLQP